MKVNRLKFPELILFEPDIYEDERGYFQETFHGQKYQEYLPQNTHFVQDNLSYSLYGTIRGFHFQKKPCAQAKLVRCVKGCILDIVVDIRIDSLNFGKFLSLEMSDQNHHQLFVPKGFAHGFSILSDYAIVEYKCDEFYRSEYDAGFRFDDEALGIDWQIDPAKMVVSEKDRNLPLLKELKEQLEGK